MDKFFTFLTSFISTVSDTKFINNLLLLAFFASFVVLFMKESKNPKSTVDWTDILLDNKTNRVSLTKIGQFIGITVSTWSIITLMQMVKPEQVDAILIWLFPMWLAFITGNWMYSSWMKTKQATNDTKPEDESKQ